MPQIQFRRAADDDDTIRTGQAMFGCYMLPKHQHTFEKLLGLLLPNPSVEAGKSPAAEKPVVQSAVSSDSDKPVVAAR